MLTVNNKVILFAGNLFGDTEVKKKLTVEKTSTAERINTKGENLELQSNHNKIQEIG